MSPSFQSRRLPAAGRTVVVVMVAVATYALLGAPASGRPRSRPVALATGTSDAQIALPGQLPGRWRLEGRRLTVRLPQPFASYSVVPPQVPPLTAVSLTAQCGENTVPLSIFEGMPYPWAWVTSASATVAPSTRVVRIVFPRDLAGRTNLCSIVSSGPPGPPPPPHVLVPLFVAGIRAAMTVRHGRISGCQPGPLERVLLESKKIRVTVAHSTDGVSDDNGFRACLLPHGSLRPIDRAADVGGNPGSVAQFTAAGTWLAWADRYVSHYSGDTGWSVRRVDMTAGRPASIDTGSGAVARVVVGASGAVAWVVEPNEISDAALPPATFTFPAAELRAQRLGGSTVVLDRTDPVTCPIGCHVDTGADLTSVVVSADGRTVTWLHSGTPRSATLA